MHSASGIRWQNQITKFVWAEETLSPEHGKKKGWAPKAVWFQLCGDIKCKTLWLKHILDYEVEQGQLILLTESEERSLGRG